jgi:NitT/TauT family transport system substrate-binding protein
MVAGCQRANQQEAKPAPAAMTAAVRLCRPATLLVPLLVAEREGLFAQQGLTVRSSQFTVGRDALEAMFRGECDLAVAAEPPVVEYALKRDDFRIITTVQSSDTMCRLLGRTDQGIGRPADLRGKRIATVKGTAPHYFLQLFLEKHRINSQEVRVEFMKSDELVTALTSGSIDAIAMTDQVTTKAEQALGAKAITFTAPGLYRNYLMVLASSALLAKEPGTGRKFLKALAQAEEFINHRPEQAQALVMAEQKLSRAQVTELWAMYDFRLSLDHPLLLGLEDTARWYLQQTGSRRPLPNFINCIHCALLASVRPDAVNLRQ